MATVLATLSVLAMYAEILLVIYVATEHGDNGGGGDDDRRLTFALVLTLLLLALLLANVVSAVLALTSVEWSYGRMGVVLFALLHVLQVGVVWRAVKLHLGAEKKAWLHLSVVRLLHAGVLSLPFLLVQGRAVFSQPAVHALHVISLVVAVVSASLALACFTVRHQVCETEGAKDVSLPASKGPCRRRLGVALLVFGTALALTSRAGSFILLSLSKNFWVLLPIGFHFLVTVVPAVAIKACEQQPCTRTSVFKEICISYINIYELIDTSDFKRVQCKYVTFYTLVVVENILMMAVWLLTSPGEYVTKLVAVVSLLAAFVFALVAKFASCGLISEQNDPDLVLSDISDVISVLEQTQKAKQQSSSVATVSTHLPDRGRGDTSSSAVFENHTTDTFLSLELSSGSALNQHQHQGRASLRGLDEGDSHTDHSTHRSEATMELFSIDDPISCSKLIRSKRPRKKPRVPAEEAESKAAKPAGSRRRRDRGEGVVLATRKSKKLAKIDPLALKEKYFKVYNRSKQKELENAGARATAETGSPRGRRTDCEVAHKNRVHARDSLSKTLEELARISRLPHRHGDYPLDSSLAEDLDTSIQPEDGIVLPETLTEPVLTEDGFPMRKLTPRAAPAPQRTEVLDFRSGLATCRMNKAPKDKQPLRDIRSFHPQVDIELQTIRTQPLSNQCSYLKQHGIVRNGEAVRPHTMCIGEKIDLDPPVIDYACHSPRGADGVVKSDKCLCNHANPWTSLGSKVRRSKERMKDAAAGFSSTIRRVQDELRKSQNSSNSQTVSTVVRRRPKSKSRGKDLQPKDRRSSFPKWVKPQDKPRDSARMRTSQPVSFDWNASVSSDTSATGDVTHVTATGSCSGSCTEDGFSSEMSSFMTWSWSHKGVILRPETLVSRQICGASEERIQRWLESVDPGLACPQDNDCTSDDVRKSSEDMNGPSGGSEVNSLSFMSLPSSARSKDSVTAEVGLPKGKHSAGKFGVGARPKYRPSNGPLFLVTKNSFPVCETEVQEISCHFDDRRRRTKRTSRDVHVGSGGRKNPISSITLSDGNVGKRTETVCDVRFPIDTMESLV